MTDRNDTTDAPTRRDYLKCGLAVGTGGLLAGCSGGDTTTAGGGDAEPEATATETTTPPSTDEATSTASQSYSATMAPVGTLELDSVPESVVGGWGFEADVMTALGQVEKLVATEGNQFWFTGFYDKLPGVETRDPDDIELVRTEDWSLKKEFLYELDPDLFATDPNRFISYYDIDKSDVQTLHDSVAPFFGNASRRKRGDWPTWPGSEAYSYYSIPEYVTRYGNLFGKAERAATINDLYRSAREEMLSLVPPKSERPTVGVLNAQINPETEGNFHVYDPHTGLEKTYGKKQYRDMGVVDAFAGEYGGQSSIDTDYEALLDADPDVIVFHFGVNYRDWNGEDALRETVEGLRDSSVGQELTAVQAGNLYVGGSAYQGPIINLFQTEMLGKQLYPEQFGEWNGDVASGELPEIPAEEQLFDRQRLADIINGDI